MGDLRGTLRTHRGEIAAVAGVVVFATVLRALGLRLGLPYYHHWDEVWITQSARSMLEHHDDLPLSFHYGAPTMLLTALGFRVVSVFRAAAPSDEVLLRWIARVVSVAISSTGAAAVYLAARPMAARVGLARPRLAAVAGGLFYATASELIMHARYGMTDAIVASLAAWSLAAASLYGSNRRLGAAIASLVFAGLAFAFKVPGLIVGVIPLAALVVVTPARPGWRHRLVVVGAVPFMLAIFIALNRHFVTSWEPALREIVGRMQQIREGGVPAFLRREPGLDHLGSALWAIVAVVPSRHAWLSLVLSAVGIAGLGRLLRARDPIAAVAVGFAVVALLNMTLPNRAFLIRNYLIEIPVIAVGFGAGVAWLAERLERRLPARFPAPAWAVVAVPLLVLPSAIAFGEAIQNQRLSVDARTRAVDFVAASVAAHAAGGTTVAYARTVADGGALGAKAHVRAALARPGVRFVRDVSSCEEAAASGAAFVITASTRSANPAKWMPYVPEWPFQDCPGFDRAASFPENPYEHNFDVTSTWDGRASALVLRRQGS